MKFILRPARPDDAEAIANAHLDALREAMPWLPVMHTYQEAIGYFRDFVLAREIVWVGEVGGAAVGFMALDGGHIDHLYVTPAHQKLGIGDALLAKAKELRPAGLKLWTFQRNLRARKFYEKRGFTALEFTDGSRNEEREPDLLYGWNR